MGDETTYTRTQRNLAFCRSKMVNRFSPTSKKKGQDKPTELDQLVMNALDEIQAGSPTPELYSGIKICRTKEVQVESTMKTVVVVMVPCAVHRTFIKPRFSMKLCEELEKKLKNKQVVIVARRTILPKTVKPAILKSRGLAFRPYSRTRTCVEKKILEDIVLPNDITGIRTVYKPGSSKCMKVTIVPEKRGDLEEKIASFSAVYFDLTRRRAEFILAEQ